MKQSCPTFRVAFAVFLLLLLSFIPHHHHEGGAVCVVEEVCELDGHTNDHHTAHGSHCDNHYCYWQPSGRTTSVQRVVFGDGGLTPFLSAEWIELPQPHFYLMDGMGLFAHVPSVLASRRGMLPSRRGPPVV